MLSGRVGTYCVTLAFICFAALSAPMRSIVKYGLVWFLVKTAILSPSAYARDAAIAITNSTTTEDTEDTGQIFLCVHCVLRGGEFFCVLIPVSLTAAASLHQSTPQGSRSS